MISRHDVTAVWSKVKRVQKEIGKIRRELVTTDIIEQDMNEFPNTDTDLVFPYYSLKTKLTILIDTLTILVHR